MYRIGNIFITFVEISSSVSPLSNAFTEVSVELTKNTEMKSLCNKYFVSHRDMGDQQRLKQACAVLKKTSQLTDAKYGGR